MGKLQRQRTHHPFSYDPSPILPQLWDVIRFRDLDFLDVKLRRFILIWVFPFVSLYLRRKAAIQPKDMKIHELGLTYQIMANSLTWGAEKERYLNVERQWHLFLRRLGNKQVFELDHDNFNIDDIQNGSCVAFTSVAMNSLLTSKPFSRDLRQLTKKLKRKNVRLVIALADSFDVAISFNAAYLISHCGGICILQTNIATEGTKFGLINVMAPVLWTVNDASDLGSNGRIPWRQRPRRAALASTGEARRFRIMSKVEKSFNCQGVDIHQEIISSYAGYLRNLRSCRFVVTTCWTQASFIRGTRKTRQERIAPTTVTHRVWEGFAAGALVITNPNPTLEAFGFLPNVHFFPLWEEDTPAEEMLLPPDEDMERMAEAGHALLTAIVNNGGFPLSVSPRDLGIAS